MVEGVSLMTAGKQNLPSSKETHITNHHLGYKPSLLIKSAVGLYKVLGSY